MHINFLESIQETNKVNEHIIENQELQIHKYIELVSIKDDIISTQKDMLRLHESINVKLKSDVELYKNKSAK